MSLVFSIHLVVMLVSFALMLVLKKRKGNTPWFVPSALALIGGSSLAAVGLGQSMSSGLSNLGPYAIGGIIIIWMVIVIIDIIRDHKPDAPGLSGLIMLPVLFQAGSGFLADFGAQLTSGTAQMAAAGFAQLVGA